MPKHELFLSRARLPEINEDLGEAVLAETRENPEVWVRIRALLQLAEEPDPRVGELRKDPDVESFFAGQRHEGMH